ncbi:CpaD family pilus assembly protein [Rhizobiaceae bacterium]|nr:CpaD family pilus assembly protein [Rhizobiaceae bacterium]
MSKHTKRLIQLAFVGSAVVLGGCAKHSERHFTVGSIPASHKVRHPIVIDEAERTLDLPVGRGAHDLDATQRGTIAAFAQDFRASSGSHLQILVPKGSPNAKAAIRIGHDVKRQMGQHGVPGGRVSLVHYDASQHGSAAPVRLSYRAVKASVTGCGKWDKDLTVTNENRNYHNFGCATQNNLAEQLANPADLLGPRAVSPIEPARADIVTGGYINGEATQSRSVGSGASTLYD